MICLWYLKCSAVQCSFTLSNLQCKLNSASVAMLSPATTARCRVLNEQQFATAKDYDYSYGQGADTFGLLRRPTGWKRLYQHSNFPEVASFVFMCFACRQYHDVAQHVFTRDHRQLMTSRQLLIL